MLSAATRPVVLPMWVAGLMAFAGGIWTFDYDGVSGSPSTNEVKQWNDAASTPIKNVRDALTATEYQQFLDWLWDMVEDELDDIPDLDAHAP